MVHRNASLAAIIYEDRTTFGHLRALLELTPDKRDVNIKNWLRVLFLLSDKIDRDRSPINLLPETW